MRNKKYSDIFIGRIIQEKVNEKNLSYTEFARMINSSRSSLYNLFSKKSIDIEQLIYIGDVLDYDFINNVYLERPEEQPQDDETDGARTNDELVEQLTEEISLLLQNKLKKI